MKLRTWIDVYTHAMLSYEKYATSGLRKYLRSYALFLSHDLQLDLLAIDCSKNVTFAANIENVLDPCSS